MACYCACPRCLSGNCCMAQGRYAPGHYPNWTVVWPPYKTVTTTTVTTNLKCVKCGGHEIGTRWHQGGYGSPHHMRCSSTEQNASGEHLHRTCQTCGYNWADEVAK